MAAIPRRGIDPQWFRRALTHSREEPTTVITIAIFHNVASYENGRRTNFDGYQPSAPLVRVFEYEQSPSEPAELIAEEAFVLCNVDPACMPPEDREIAQRYRNRRLRSLSVG